MCVRLENQGGLRTTIAATDQFSNQTFGFHRIGVSIRIVVTCTRNVYGKRTRFSMTAKINFVPVESYRPTILNFYKFIDV